MIRKIGIVVLILMNIGCDQLSKQAVRKNVVPNGYIEVVGTHLILTHVENTGAMLGLGRNLPPILKIFFLQAIPTMVLLVLLYRIFLKKNPGRWPVIAFAFVIGGGIGNLVDRIVLGSVTDFFLIELGFFKTGIFNMADVSVTLGVLIILFLSVRDKNPSL